jgi:hypothetical protein
MREQNSQSTEEGGELPGGGWPLKGVLKEEKGTVWRRP